MAAEPDLESAAFGAVDNLLPWLADNTLKSRLAAFAENLNDEFPDGTPNDRPVGNWLGLIAVVSDRMPAANVPFTEFMTSADYVYKICWMANQLDVQGLITPAQAAAVLAEYNANF